MPSFNVYVKGIISGSVSVKDVNSADEALAFVVQELCGDEPDNFVQTINWQPTYEILYNDVEVMEADEMDFEDEIEEELSS